MSSRSDPYVDDRTRDEDDLADYGDRPPADRADADEPYAADDEDRRWLPYFPSWGWGGAWGVWPWAAREDEDARYDDDAYEDAGSSPYDEETGYDDRAGGGGGIASLWDESLITLLIVGGAVLFVFPEPATSGLGVLLMTLGVIAWLVDWAA